jgi:hypothetical protein
MTVLKFEGLFGKDFKLIKTPMSEGYHPGIDGSPLCIEDDSTKYRSIIGCWIWIFFSDIFYKAYVTSPIRSKWILSYFKIFPKGRVIIDISYLYHSIYPVGDHSTPGGCTTFTSLMNGSEVFPKNDAASGASIIWRSEKMMLMIDTEFHQ